MGIPWFTVGYGADIAVLITGKNHYDSDIGWHRCKNDAEEVNAVKEYLVNDNKAYSAYRKACRKDGEKENAGYFDMIPCTLS